MYADSTERGQRPAPESLHFVRKSGDLALRTPRANGGAWAGASVIARRLADLGRACPSTAWIVGTCVTSKTFAARAFGDTAELFADPDALMCGSGVPAGRLDRGGGEIRLTGRWPNVSGCEDATWASVGVMDCGAFSVALVPVADLTIDRTWEMAGMRGTGSHTLVADGITVPAERIGAVAMPFPVADRLTFALTVLGPVVGATRGALDVVDTMFASDRKPFMTAYARMADSPGARGWLARAAQLTDRAERTMLAIAAAADDDTTTPADATRLSMDLADAAADCRAALELMMDLHGASGFAEVNPLQRYWRDVAVGSRHPHLNPYLAVENYGTARA